MRTRMETVIVWTVLAVAAALPVSVNAITIDARDLESSTNISEAVDGVAISALINTSRTSYEPVREDVYADPDSDAIYYEPGTGAFTSASGISQFGDLADFWTCSRGSIGGCGTALAVLEFEFETPVDYLLFGGSDPADPLGFIAFDAFDGVVGGCYAPVVSLAGCGYSTAGDGIRNQVWMHHSSVEIARVWVAAAFYTSTVNMFSFGRHGGSVPEPAPLALFGFGLVALLRRRRQLVSRQ